MSFKNFMIILSVVFMMQSCKIISFTKSELNDVDPEGISLSESCKLYSTGIVYMNFAGIIKANLLPASFKIEYKDKLIYIDPVLVDDTAKADIIFISHVHNDHFSKTDIKKISNSETLIIAPEPVTKKLKGYKTRTVKIGDSIKIKDIGCEVVYAYNTQKGFMGMIIHPKGSDNVGYIITCGDIRIYHAGDTDLIPEMKTVNNITVALMPIGEGKTAMNPKSASDAVDLINPEIVIPIHYEVGQNRVEEFKKYINKSIRIITLRK